GRGDKGRSTGQLCRKLVVPRRRPSACENNHRLSHPVLSETVLDASSSSFSPSAVNGVFPKYEHSNSISSVSADDNPGFRNLGIPLSDVSCRQRKRVHAPCFQPEASQRVCLHKTIQAGEPCKNSLLPSKERFHGKHRSFPGLLPYSSTSKSSALPLFCPRGQGLQMDKFTLWTRLCPPGICSALELGGLDIEKERDSHSGVSGRLSLCCSRSLTSPDANRLDSESVGSPRLGCEPGKIGPDSNAEDRLPRYILGHSAAPHFPSIEQSFSVGTTTSEVYPLSLLESEVSSECNRFVEFRGVHSSLGPSSSQRDSDSQSSPTSSIPSSSSSHSLSSPVRVKMVHLQSGELCSPSAIARTFMSTDASDEGWGAVLENVSIQGTWTQKQRSWHISWQPEGVVCGSEGDSILPQSGGEPLVSSSVGQQDCCGLHSQTGGATLSHSPERNKEVTVSDIHAEHSYNPPLHTGKVQLSRRRSLSAGSSPRLACSSTADQVSVPSLGSAGDRPVCDLSIESRPALCVVGSSRQTGDLHRRVLQGLEGLELAWVFPPPPLLPQVLHHLNRASGLFIVVAPRWQKTFWRADLKTRAIAPPFVVQDPRSRVMDLSTGLPPPLAENLMLEIWLIRGGINKLRGGRKLKNVC
ncbi:hypothetical protein WDU94_010815, partial [Cyamophila willieti]